MFPGKAKLSQYVVWHDNGSTAFLWSTRSGRTVEVPSYSWHSWAAGAIPPQTGLLADRLKQANILVPNEQDEKAVVLAENEGRAQHDTELDLVILPSANCPLGCNLSQYGGYCGQTHTREGISSENSIRILEFLLRSIKPQHRVLRITWFGAEPLLALSQIREMTPALLRIAAERGLSYISTLVTGGTLFSHAVARECLQDLGIQSVSITVDGVSAAHDERRPTKAGRPTFARIINNLEAIINDSSLDSLRISLRCNVDARNEEAPSQLITFFARKQWQGRVDLYFAPVHPWGEHMNESALNGPQFAALEVQWHREQIAAGFAPVLLPPRKPIVCRVVSPSRLVVAHDGKLHRCTESPLTPVNAQRDELGFVQAIREASDVRTWSWHDDIRQGTFPCSNCVYLPCCGGACPLSWQSGSDVPCPPFKHNGPERLAVLRSQVEHAPAPSWEGHHPGSILGLLGSLATSSADACRVSELDAQLRQMRLVSSEKEWAFNAHALECWSQRPWADWRLGKLERAAQLSAAAYLYYRIEDIDRVFSATEGALTCLHAVAMAGDLDVRLAQLQLLLNFLAAQYKIQHQFDQLLSNALEKYLDGKISLKLGSVIVPRLSPSESRSEFSGALRRSLLSLVGQRHAVAKCS